MIGYVMLGTNDIERARRFYDPLMKMIGSGPLDAWTSERTIFYGSDPAAAVLMITKPYDGQPATAGNGTMVALSVSSRDLIDRAHALALELGGSDEGSPGPRGDDPNGFYGAYVRDPDGNKLCLFRMGPA